MDETFEFPLRIERCACRGAAIASGGLVVTVMAAIRRHNTTPQHDAWRRRRMATS